MHCRPAHEQLKGVPPPPPEPSAWLPEAKEVAGVANEPQPPADTAAAQACNEDIIKHRAAPFVSVLIRLPHNNLLGKCAGLTRNRIGEAFGIFLGCKWEAAVTATLGIGLQLGYRLWCAIPWNKRPLAFV